MLIAILFSFSFVEPTVDKDNNLSYPLLINPPSIIMTNITSTLLDTLTLNSTGTEWPVVDIIGNNSHEIDTLSFIITPLAVVAKKANETFVISPVTLSAEWSRLVRLIFLTIISVIGSVGNIFMISSVMIEDHLKKAGKHGDGLKI